MKTWRHVGLFLILVLLLSACGAGGRARPASSSGAQAKAARATLPISAATPTAGTGVADSSALLPGTDAGSKAYGELAVPDVEPGAGITFSGWGDAAEQQVYRDSIARFNQFYPDVKVDYRPVPSGFETTLQAQMAGGQGPDVLYVNYQLMTTLGLTGQLLPLDDYLQQAGGNRNAFIPQLLTGFTSNNRIYALPKDWSTLALIYLPAAFQAANIREPTDKWTWNDLQNASEAIGRTGKFRGFCIAPDWAHFVSFVFQNGGDIATRDGKTVHVDSAPVKEAATFVSGLKQSGALVTPSELSAGSCGEAMGKQLVGMTYEDGRIVDLMKRDYPGVQWKAVPLPAGPKGQADVLFGNGIGVNAATRFPKAAAALAIFLTSRYNQAEIAKTGLAYSTHPDQVDLIQNPVDKAFAAGGRWPNSKPGYWGPNTTRLEDVVARALQRVFGGTQDVNTSFAQAQQELQPAPGGK
jgi:multiple sugar transport system substrate-binding protein